MLVFVLAYQLYRRIPPVTVRPRWAAVGALLFVAGHELAMILSDEIAARLSHRAVIYGSFLGLVSLVAWVYWLSSVLLLAAELTAELNGDRRHGPAAGAEDVGTATATARS